MPARLRSNPLFDELFEAGAQAVLRGEHERDTPPVDGGRWPVTVVCIPALPVRRQLTALMRSALAYAGPGHFLTGRPGVVHLTVRALEPYRHLAAPGDAITSEWLAALGRAARVTAPLALRLTGVTLTRGSVMAQVEPLDDAPWEFMRRLRAELGPLAWYEDQWMERNIWYATLVHFAAPLADPRGLVDWVAQNRVVEPMEFLVDGATLVRSRHTRSGSEQYMAMEQWQTVPFGPVTT